MLLDIGSFRTVLRCSSSVEVPLPAQKPAVTFTLDQYVKSMSEIAYLIVRVPLPSAISVNTFAAFFLIEKPSSEAARSFVSPGFEPVKQSCAPR